MVARGDRNDLCEEKANGDVMDRSVGEGRCKETSNGNVPIDKGVWWVVGGSFDLLSALT